jgi:hypothetical protein
MLLTAVQRLSPSLLTSYLATWRDKLRHELSTNQSGCLGRKYPVLAQAIPNDFPNQEILSHYITPLTSWSADQAALILPSLQPANPNISELVRICQRRFTWGTNSGIQEKFSNILWDALCIQMLFKVRFPAIYAWQVIPKHAVIGQGGLGMPTFNLSSILAICRVRRKETLVYYQVKYSVKGLSDMIDSYFHPVAAAIKPDHPQSHCTRKVWIPDQIVEHAIPVLVAAYNTRRKSAVRPVRLFAVFFYHYVPSWSCSSPAVESLQLMLTSLI